MKKITLFFLMFLFCPRYHLFAQPAPPSGQTWKLVVSDDFDSFNDSLWGHGGTPWNTESHDGECNLQTLEDSWVSDGNLVLRSRKGPIKGPSGKVYPYAGSYVWTKVKHTYGYLEIRAKHPNDVPGTWPAFWMLTGDSVYDTEIDIAEFRGEPLDYMTHAYFGDGKWDDFHSYGDFSEWHTFGLEWSPGSLKYYIDGEVKFTVARKSPSKPMYVLLSHGVECPETDGTGFPNYYNIDYFRWYQLAPDDDDKRGASSQSFKRESTTENINNSSKRVTVYPNPVKGGNFIIQFQPQSDVDVQLFDVHGKLVLRQKGAGGKLEINRSLPPGVYMLKVSNKKFAETKKIVVQ